MGLADKIASVFSKKSVNCEKYVCKKCEKEFNNELLICPECGAYVRMNSHRRIETTADRGTFNEMFSDITSKDILNFPSYAEKLEKAKEDTGENEAVVCGVCEIGGVKCGLFVMNSYFMMGSMGSAVGEKITLLFEYCTKEKLPIIGFTASGGARMQEGIFSLMQMAKVSAAVKHHSDGGNLYITVLTDPTTGGVTASFAMEGDIIIAEPNALIGFAGARVIKQTTGGELPKGFQRAEFLLEHGFVDIIIKRDELKQKLTNILLMHRGDK